MKDDKAVKIPTGARLRTLGTGNFFLCLFIFNIIAAVTEVTIKAGSRSAEWVSGYFALFFTVNYLVLLIGIIFTFLSSTQLGLKRRIICVLIGLIPFVNSIADIIILSKTLPEYFFEKKKLKTDRRRAADKICQTKYPLVMVHGIFFRDFRYFNYWGRIPAELERNGATIYYGQQESAETIEKSAQKVFDRVKEIVETTGCGKVNIIAHSKGGLDTKYAITRLGMDKYVASVTTINTPHRGCEFAEYLLEQIDEPIKEKVAAAYNSTLRKLGDKDPDFLLAVTDLTKSRTSSISSSCDLFDYKAAGIYTASVGSCMRKAASGAFPLNMSYNLVKRFDGPNDGLVGEPSFKWGEDYKLITNTKKQGISHGDMIDLNRVNIPGFDVREFYVQLVGDLKARGL